MICYFVTVLDGFVVGSLALTFTCIRAFLGGKLWENRYVFGMMLIMFDSLISSPPHPTLVTVVDSLCPVCPVKSVMVFLFSLPGIGCGMDMARVGRTSLKCFFASEKGIKRRFSFCLWRLCLYVMPGAAAAILSPP